MGGEEIRESVSDYPNSGILNPNKYHRDGSKMPTHNGNGQLTCKHCQQVTAFEIAMWNRGRFLTMAFTEKELSEKKRAEAKARKAGLATADEAANQAEMPVDSGETKTGEVLF